MPTVPQDQGVYTEWFQWLVPQGQKTIPLAQLEADLAVVNAEKKATAVPVKNEPPQIIFSQNAAVLVHIDGEPAWHPVPNTAFERVVNTRALVLRFAGRGPVFVHLLNGWIDAPTLAGPWTISRKIPPGADPLATELDKAGIVDLMEGSADPATKKKPTLQAGMPSVFVAFKPTEVITFQGPANWGAIDSTNLLYVQNTTGNVFQDTLLATFYVLISGRWFSAAAMTGPWTYLPATSLPPDFAQMPDTCPKENVKASIPGTRQAQEAVIAAQVPQSALVYLDKVTFTPVINGLPILQGIPGTSLSYVVNSPDPIIQVSPMVWYAVQNGVWFTAVSAPGPWKVATTVPPVLYTIPVSSPLYYVTYVQVYNATPTYVVVGYTPGYMGVYVAPGGVVIYGTGYTYDPYIGATVWYGPPMTYGYGMAVTYTPWTGWTYGYGFGMPVGAAVCWGAAPYWGPYYAAYGYHGAYYGTAYGYHGGSVAWGPGGWAATSGNVYSHYGSTSVESHSSAGYNAYTGNAWNSQAGHSYNSATGQMSAGQRGTVTNAYTGGYASGARGATYNPNTGVSASGSKATVGNAYTGQQASVAHGTVTGAGGQSASGTVAHSGDNYYASSNGNVYKYNSQTGTTQQYDKGGGGWGGTDGTGSQYSQQQHNASQSGAQRSGSAQSWGGGGGGGGGFGGGGGGGFGGGGGGWGSGGGDRGGGGGWGGGGGGGGGGWGGGGGGGGWGGGGGRGGGGRR